MRRFIFRIAYPATLLALSFCVLIVFVWPVSHVRDGLNGYGRCKFLAMVNGAADKPFVYRTLLPTAVHLVSSLTPSRWRQAFTAIARRRETAFRRLGWETSAAGEYAIALILMLLCFAGFAHYSAKLVMLTCSLKEAQGTRLLLAAAVLAGLPPFFRYTSYLYDPPQLLLFTMALYFLAASRFRAFGLAFVLCCLNKETALLLIPIYVLVGRQKFPSPRRYWGLLLGLVIVYIGVRLLLMSAFRYNAGSVADFQFTHTLAKFVEGWTFTDAIAFMLLAFLVFLEWNDKPRFLKVSFLALGPPLIVLTLFWGYVDEWRVYYEVYPIVFGLIVDSYLRVRRGLHQSLATASQ
jgi:hypothetical protein